MIADDFTTPNRIPVPEPTTTRICSTCAGQGWIPFDRRLSTTRNPLAVSLVIRCAECNHHGRIPVPTAEAAKAILEGRIS